MLEAGGLPVPRAPAAGHHHLAGMGSSSSSNWLERREEEKRGRLDKEPKSFACSVRDFFETLLLSMFRSRQIEKTNKSEKIVSMFSKDVVLMIVCLLQRLIL